MNIRVVVPSWDLDRALATVDNLTNYAKPSRPLFIVPTHSYGKYTQSSTNIIIQPNYKPEGVVKSMANGAIAALDLPSGKPDIIVFCHDDMRVYEDWVTPLEAAFSMNGSGRLPLNIGLIGFHGAKELGSSDIYRTPYRLDQMARFNPMSNMVDAESHGKRVTLFTRVATVDGFFMAFSAQAYKDMGGWQTCLQDGLVFHNYDNWAAMRMHELGYGVYMAPVSCSHQGGGTSVTMSAEYEAWAKANGFKDSTEVHSRAHKVFYERFRGELPLRVR